MATDKPLKVLLVTGSFPPMRCGVGDYTCLLATELAADSQLRVGVLTMKAAAQAAFTTAFQLFPVIERWDESSKSAITDVVATWKPDVIHFQFPTLGYVDTRLPWRLPLYFFLCGIPIVQTWHELTFLMHPIKLRSYIRSYGMITMSLVPGGLIVVHRDYLARIRKLLRPLLANKIVRFIPNASAIPSVQLSPLERTAIRDAYAHAKARIVAFFGLLYAAKGIELLFEIADPRTSHVVIVGGSIRPEDAPASRPWDSNEYEEKLRILAEAEAWRGKVTFTGFLPAEEAARILACADAVVLPFQKGAGEWNTSLHAAQAQGTFALTTSITRRGYDAKSNTYYAAPDDVMEMKKALAQYIGVRTEYPQRAEAAWQATHVAHAELYAKVIQQPRVRMSSFRSLLAKAALRLV